MQAGRQAEGGVESSRVAASMSSRRGLSPPSTALVAILTTSHQPIKMNRIHPTAAPANHGSRTLLLRPEQQQEAQSSNNAGVLRLRGATSDPTRQRRVLWTQDTVDNEHMGKKSSKSKLCSHGNYTTTSSLTTCSSPTLIARQSAASITSQKHSTSPPMRAPRLAPHLLAQTPRLSQERNQCLHISLTGRRCRKQ